MGGQASRVYEDGADLAMIEVVPGNGARVMLMN